ncbi:MAG: TetR/AcrR family transcriptional regulator [Planctomycetota bacterium]
MQRIDERKRREIVNVAARLFASRPFHQVRLEDVAAAAGIGKGTIYIYFATKEDLYGSLLHEQLLELTVRIERAIAPPGGSAWDALAATVGEIVAFSAQHPELFEMLRAGWIPTSERLHEQRRTLLRLLSGIIRNGIRSGELADANPTLTATFILSAVRGAMLYRTPRTSASAIARHLLRLIGKGIRKRS